MMKRTTGSNHSLTAVLIRVLLTLVIALAAAIPTFADSGSPITDANSNGQGKAKGHEKVQPGKVEPPRVPTQRQFPVTSSKKKVKQQQAPEAQAALQAVSSIDMKLLVIAADGNETDYPAIVAFLQQIGIPYTTLMAAQTTLTASMLSDGAGRGYYQGIILTTGSLIYDAGGGNWVSALTDAEWQILQQYEANFGVRQLTSYTAPYAPYTYGLNLVDVVDTTSTPLQATLTSAGQSIYSYLNVSSPITFKNAWVYRATVADPAVTTPLLVTPEGYAIASITTYPDGRQNLAVTAANNPYLLHSLLLSYGNINWVTKGLFLGERHVNFGPQIDDLLIDDDMWDTTALTDTTGLAFRMSGSDFTAAIAWQNSTRAIYPLARSLTLEWAFNGEGGTGIYSPDTLTPAVKQYQAAFNYVNHTYTHANLDTISTTAATQELTLNHNAATRTYKFTRYFKDALVQPDISGLNNPNFLLAAKNFGIKYLISDTSQPGWNNPSPNAGFYSTYQPSILIIPRRPTNLFYNLRTPAEWVSEYNCYYGPTGTCAGGQWRYWDHNLTYTEILDKESEFMLQYLLKWDLDPLMFHQPNVGAYDGVHSLLGDLINATLAKYSAVYNLPIRNLSQHDIGLKMAARMTYNASGVTGRFVPCTSLTITSPKAVVVPITGVANGTNREVYGGQNISYVTLGAGQTKTIPLTCP